MKKVINLLLIFSLTFWASHGLAYTEEPTNFIDPASFHFSFRDYFENIDGQLETLQTPEEKSALLLDRYKNLLMVLKILEKNISMEVEPREYQYLVLAIKKLEALTFDLQHNKKINFRKANQEISQSFWDHENPEGQQRFIFVYTAYKIKDFVIWLFTNPITAYVAGVLTGFLYAAWSELGLSPLDVIMKIKQWITVSWGFWSKKFNSLGDAIDGVWDYWFG